MNYLSVILGSAVSRTQWSPNFEFEYGGEIEATKETIAVVMPEAAPAKAENKRPARSRKPKTETKPVDLAAVGLQLVETKTDAPKATASVESTKPKAPRKAAAWQKNTKEEGNPEPLVMVETQNK